MQTFLPYDDFVASLKCLDYRRLGKQRVEAYQLLCALQYSPAVTIYQQKTGRMPTTTWAKHPAAKMWKGYESSLAIYYDECVNEWVGRGFKNTMPYIMPDVSDPCVRPPWFGDPIIHGSHRSALYRKDPNYYKQFANEPHYSKYYWAVNDESTRTYSIVSSGFNWLR